MRHKDVVAIANQLEQDWEMFKSEILDKENQFYESQIEKEFFEHQCFIMGLTDKETSLVMEQLGY